ncbi:type II secretion system protein [Planococcus salinarum]|uniref:type II secretion system protein n=1 Tax=Planococcus salinarum TaxID=622695 RepID=UPI00163DCE17|nr:type II secretion system protein [Planococcus salinarum]
MNSNEKGLTLVEVLAALVILGILFVGIMTIFPQMTLFNEKTEAKLDTMNLARQEMAKISDTNLWIRKYDSSAGESPGYLKVEGPIIAPDLSIESVMDSLSYTVDLTDPVFPDYKRFYNIPTVGDYHYIADVYTVCEPFPPPPPPTSPPPATPPAIGSCEPQDLVKLHKVHLKVMMETKPGSGSYRMSSETFSYIPYKEIDTK